MEDATSKMFSGHVSRNIGGKGTPSEVAMLAAVEDMFAEGVPWRQMTASEVCRRAYTHQTNFSTYFPDMDTLAVLLCRRIEAEGRWVPARLRMIVAELAMAEEQRKGKAVA